VLVIVTSVWTTSVFVMTVEWLLCENWCIETTTEDHHHHHWIHVL